MAESTRHPEIQAIYDELTASTRAQLAERGEFDPAAIDAAVAFVVQTFQRVHAMHLDTIDWLAAKFRGLAADPRFAGQASGLSLAAKILAESVEGER